MSSLDLSFLFLLTSVITPFPQGPTLSASSVLRSFLFPFSFFFPISFALPSAKTGKSLSLSWRLNEYLRVTEEVFLSPHKVAMASRAGARATQNSERGSEFSRGSARYQRTFSCAARRRTESLIVVSGLSSRRSRRRLLSPPSLAQLFARPPPAIGIGVRPPTHSQTITRPSWHPLRLLHAEDARP